MTTSSLDKLNSAPSTLSEGAKGNIRKWLTESRYAAYVPQVIEHIAAEKWQQLDDAFWTIIPFGTGGRRGRMYPIGSNAINDRTIGESAQGLAEYVKEHHDGDELSCALAYDTRHNSRHFAELCAGIMVAAGFKVHFLDDYRSTPELSYLVRHKKCSCGIMVTASHNPPSDNAVKVYWSTGAQILPPHDKAIIDRVMNVQEIKQSPFDQALADGQVVICTEEIDAAYIAQVKGQRLEGPRNLKIIFSPLHGVGSSAVCPALAADGFTDVEVFADHATPDGDFPNVPGHVSNPENPAVFDSIIMRAKEAGADLILATDPDCDRMGVAAPVTTDPQGEWRTFTGNQLGALLIDYVLERRSRAGTLTPEHYVVKTLVTTEMGRRIADSYNVTTYGNLHVGFKWIAGLIDEVGPERFVFGTEESHGYMAGTYVRDKDGGVACMLLAELAACVKAEGKSLHEKLESLWWQHGYHAERTINVFMEGSEGMSRMKALMAAFRTTPPQHFGGIDIAQIRDYQGLTITKPDGTREPLECSAANMVILDLVQDGNYIAVRPSGTEPKVKFYMFTFVPAEQLADLEMTAQQMEQRMDKMAADVQAFADAC
ncbi:MAG: phospho-sugar mutase [Planctomycetota bacterium]|nr:phospho-sugar mutase [Planctomycetota bacterium]